MYDSDYSASAYYGAVYTGDKGGRDDGRHPGISVIGGDTDHIHREPGIQSVYGNHPGNHPGCAVVSWERRSFMASGLNCIYGCRETRNYIVLRIRATVYTVLFIIVIILLLVLSVFGNTLNLFIAEHIPFLRRVADQLIEARVIITPTVLLVFSLMLYRYLPNRRGRFRDQLPGAMFAAVGWMVISWVFSVYLDVFKGFSNMYGSLTTIVLIMLWMYFCMYCILIGGEMNMLFEGKIFEKK